MPASSTAQPEAAQRRSLCPAIEPEPASYPQHSPSSLQLLHPKCRPYGKPISPLLSKKTPDFRATKQEYFSKIHQGAVMLPVPRQIKT